MRIRRFPRMPIDRSKPPLGIGGARVTRLYENGASAGISFTIPGKKP